MQQYFIFSGKFFNVNLSVKTTKVVIYLNIKNKNCVNVVQSYFVDKKRILEKIDIPLTLQFNFCN